MSIKLTYSVLGSGMQGTAAAYDIAKFGDAGCIRMGDVSLEQAEKSCRRVNELIGEAICEPHQVNALDPVNLGAFLKPATVVVSCVPYWMHPKIAKVAIEVGTSMVDLGGNTDVTMETLKMNEEAFHAGVTVVPDCGLAPGLVNNLGCYCMEHLDTANSVKMYCGVLPQNPKPPLNYMLTFNVEGLLTEYDYKAVVIRNHEVALVDTLDELESLQIEGLGRMEAFTTSGGTSTAPYTFKEKVTNYEYKTIRYPGHCAQMRLFKDFGFWGEEEVHVHGVKVKPRMLWYELMGPKLESMKDLDLCAVRAVGVGEKDGKQHSVQIDILDKQCQTTGFTSMERLTGFSAAVYAIAIAKKELSSGCLRYETAMTGTKFVEEIQRRGVHLHIQENHGV